MTHSFLVEIGTEELPPTSLKELSSAFQKNTRKSIEQKRLAYKTITSFATPRRLAIVIEGLDESTPVEHIKVWGPPAKVAFDTEGKPTKAALAFAQKNSIKVEELATENDGKQDKLCCISETGGERTKALLGDIIRQALTDLPIKKRMRWGASRNEFVRPVHWVVMLLDNEVLNESILGIGASNKTRGHRFHANESITITCVENYSAILEEQGNVIASFERRQEIIRQQVTEAARQLNGHAVISDDLLEEVTALVELPVALAGKFDEAFLKVPSEALISSMKEHQKYFHVVDENKNLLPIFITVSNIKSKDPAQVIDGNERVIRPRLSDAAFFFETDKKVSQVDRREKLKSVLFQAKLGSVFEKTERIAKLAKYIADSLNVDDKHVLRAARLCKSDLVSSMVYEFPDMQGIAGYHYAQHDGESDEVAKAMQEQYQPKFSGDSVADSDVGAIIALADRLDTVTGIFGIGQKPSGSKDPFALRRASLGILRILVEKSYDLDLRDLVAQASEGFPSLPKAEAVVDEVLMYCLERFRAWYEEENISAEVFQSVHAKELSTPFDINRRVHAVAEFSKLAEAQSLAAANKRVSNILAKQSDSIKDDVEASQFNEDAERDLYQALEKAVGIAGPLIAARDYTSALSELARLRDSVDNFFDHVMVMTDDLILRQNRLALLNRLRSIFLEVADISYLAVKA